MKVVVWAILFVAVVVACAIDQPPPGGPLDEIPPSVRATSPARDSAGVDPGSEIAITFSEDMSRKGAERLVFFNPPIEIGRVRWKDQTIFIQPAQPLHPDTTYIVTVRPGIRDYHKVATKEGMEFAFATSAAIDSGTISGRVFFRREPTRKGVVHCWALPVDSAFVPEAVRADREARTDENGDYSLRYLGNRGTHYIVWAFEDANANATFAPENEAGMLLADTVTLTQDGPFAAGVDIWIVDPNEPAEVAGMVVNRSGLDTFAVSVALYVDSLTARPTYLQACDSTGAFQIANVRGATYLMKAFIDVTPDSSCGWYPCFDDSTVSCREPCVLFPDTLTVEPGASVELDTLVLEPSGERRE